MAKKKKKSAGQTTLDKYYPVGYTPSVDKKQSKRGNENKNDSSPSSSSKQESAQLSLKGSTGQMNDLSVQESPGPSKSIESQRNFKDDEFKAQEASARYKDSDDWNCNAKEFVSFIFCFLL